MSDSPIAVQPISSSETAIAGPLFTAPTDEIALRYADALARYLPNDELFSAKYVQGSNLRSLLRGLARRMMQADQFITELLDEYIPDNTTQFIDEWEVVLGIPDGCFDGGGTATDRRTAILVKLASLGVQTVDDFVLLALKLGITVNVYAGGGVFQTPSLAPGVTFRDIKEARYTIVVTYDVAEGFDFPYTYPIPFGSSEIAVLQCLFNQVKPANNQVIFDKV